MKRAILGIILASTIAIVDRPSSMAAAPALTLGCGTPSSQNIVPCRLSGTGFHPYEGIRITYRITFLSLPTRDGKHPEKVYVRAATTDRRGNFVRPPLRFGVVRSHESFRLSVHVRGALGDRSTTTFTAIAQ